MHLGETVVPYTPRSIHSRRPAAEERDGEIPADENGVGGIRIGGLERRMRDRWQTVLAACGRRKSNLPIKLNLLGSDWTTTENCRRNLMAAELGKRPLRVVYTGWPADGGNLLSDDATIVDYKLFWIACKNEREAYYLLAIINSETLYEAVKPLMSKGQFGARDLQKHLWKLPIPEFDPAVPLHAAIADAGQAAATGAAQQLAELRASRPRISPSPSPAANSANGSARPPKARPWRTWWEGYWVSAICNTRYERESGTTGKTIAVAVHFLVGNRSIDMGGK